jgi:hypothetical protein
MECLMSVSWTTFITLCVVPLSGIVTLANPINSSPRTEECPTVPSRHNFTAIRRMTTLDRAEIATFDGFWQSKPVTSELLCTQAGEIGALSETHLSLGS